MKRRIAIVGAGHRATRFIDEIAENHRPTAELVALCDPSRVRMEAHNRWLAGKHGLGALPLFGPDQFAAMVRETRPDVVLVTTIDAQHHFYIVAALELGCDVITEKPMTTDVDKCRLILEAAGRHPERQVTVAFNYRWAPTNTQVKALLRQGAIGTVKSVNLEWLLDLKHGADYFRRWHSEKAHSGGLLVHKATHHFDLVNWWTDDIPESVFATGSLGYYGKANAIARGEIERTAYARYTGQAAARKDPFYLGLDQNEHFEALYLRAEAETGYVRDRNVFREGIDIEDQATVLVRYRSGLLLTYSLNAFSPREGMRAVFNGDRGRIEYYQFEKSKPCHGRNDEGHQGNGHAETHAGALATEQTFIRVYPHFGRPYTVEAHAGPGGHWGGDPLMIAHLFGPQAGRPDPLGRTAGQTQGAASVLVGFAANESIRSGRPIRIEDLLPLPAGSSNLSTLA